MQRLKLKTGNVTAALLIVVGAFMVVIYALVLVLSTQLDFSHRQIGSEMALQIAEAGVNYYRWHLAHDPLDFKDGTTSSGPYVHSYTDPQGAKIGQFSLVVTAPVNGSSIVTIESTGSSDRFPNIKRIVKAQYAKPSLAKFSFLQNASSWYGTGITVNGEVHSNNGIRMDGNNTSKVTSSLSTYTCGTETGCSPSTQQPGVWGAGAGRALWQYPVPATDFNAISFDFTQMKSAAQANGLYLSSSGFAGYHILFSSNGTFVVKRVKATSYINAYTPENGCIQAYQVITNETQVGGTYNVSSVPIVFAEDHLWVEGVVKGKISVVAARFPLNANDMNIWIPNNLTYVTYDHTNNLGLISQNDIYFTRDIPTDFKVDGALIAQSGKVIRHGYLAYCGSTTNAVRNSFTFNGSLISNDKSYWNFGTAPDSGFVTRQTNYDADLLLVPPPYFPTSGDYEFVSWTEK